MKILLGYDGSDCSIQALTDLTRAGLPSRGQMTVVSVLEHWLPPPSGLEIAQHLTRDTEMLALARRAAAWLRPLFPDWEINAESDAGAPATVLLARVEQWRPDLLVVGSHGRTAAGRFFFGSVSQKLVHQSPISVRISRGPAQPRTDAIRLIAAVDGSHDADLAIDAITSRTWPAETQARIVHAAWTLPPAAADQMMVRVTDWIATEKARVEKAIAAADRKLSAAGLQTSILVREEDPRKLLVEQADMWDADCLFVGAQGHNRLERMLTGSVSAGVAARARCSVEIIRPAPAGGVA